MSHADVEKETQEIPHQKRNNGRNFGQKCGPLSQEHALFGSFRLSTCARKESHNVNNTFFCSFGENDTNKLAKIEAKHTSQNSTFRSDVSNSFVYPFLGDKPMFNLLLDLAGMNSFRLSR